MSQPRQRSALSGYGRMLLGAAGLIFPAVVMVLYAIAMKVAFEVAGFDLLGAAIFTILVWTTHGWGVEQYQRGKRIVVAARDATEFDPSRPFILYLRGFAEDYATAGTLGEPTVFLQAFASLFRFPMTEEEHLARALGAFGDVVAVGEPGEDMPLLGAKRVYMEGPDWQERVRVLMRQAQFVVVRLSSAPGVVWELDTALRDLPPEKIAILVPEREAVPDRQIFVPGDADVGWRALERALGGYIPYPEYGKPSPKLGTLRILIWFTASKKPMMHALRKNDVEPRLSRYPLADMLRDEFTPLMARAGVRTRQRFMWLRRGGALAVDAALTSLVSMYMTFKMLPRTSEPPFFVFDSWQGWTIQCVPFVYFVVFELLFSTTVGKWATRLRVVPAGDRRRAAPRTLLRNVLKYGTWSAGLYVFGESTLVFSLLAGLYLLPPLMWGRTFYDIASGKQVIGTSRIERALRSPQEAGVGQSAMA